MGRVGCVQLRIEVREFLGEPRSIPIWQPGTWPHNPGCLQGQGGLARHMLARREHSFESCCKGCFGVRELAP